MLEKTGSQPKRATYDPERARAGSTNTTSNTAPGTHRESERPEQVSTGRADSSFEPADSQGGNSYAGSIISSMAGDGLPQALIQHKPQLVASSVAYTSYDGYGAGPGNRLIPVHTPGGKRSLSANEASDAMASAYGLTTPEQQKAFRQLGLFKGNMSVVGLPNGAFMPINIAPEMHNQLVRFAAGVKGQQQAAATAAAARERQAAAKQTEVSGTLESGRFYPNRSELYSSMRGAGVGRGTAEALLKKNDENVTKYLNSVNTEHSKGSHYSNLSDMMPALTESGYLNQGQAQKMLDRNWLNWASNSLQSGAKDAPSLEQINERGYEIISRSEGKEKERFKSEVQELKNLRNERDGRTATTSKPESALRTDELGLPLVSPEEMDQLWAGNTLQALKQDGLLSTPSNDPNQARLEQARPETLGDRFWRGYEQVTEGVRNGRPGAAGGMAVQLETATELQIKSAQNMPFWQEQGVKLRETLGLVVPGFSTLTDGMSAVDLELNPEKEEIYARTAEEARNSALVGAVLDGVGAGAPFILNRGVRPDVPTGGVRPDVTPGRVDAPGGATRAAASSVDVPATSELSGLSQKQLEALARGAPSAADMGLPDEYLARARAIREGQPNNKTPVVNMLDEAAPTAIQKNLRRNIDALDGQISSQSLPASELQRAQIIRQGLADLEAANFNISETSLWHSTNSDSWQGLKQSDALLSGAELKRQNITRLSGEGDQFTPKAGEKDVIFVGKGPEGAGSTSAYFSKNRSSPRYNPSLYSDAQLKDEIAKLQDLVNQRDWSRHSPRGMDPLQMLTDRPHLESQLRRLEAEQALRANLPERPKAYPMMFEFDGQDVTTKMTGNIPGEATVEGRLDFEKLQRVFVPADNVADARRNLAEIGRSDVQVISFEAFDKATDYWNPVVDPWIDTKADLDDLETNLERMTAQLRLRLPRL